MAFDTSHIENLPDGLDPEIVKQTQQGKGWGAQDQARYDAAVAKRGEAKDVHRLTKPRLRLSLRTTINSPV